MLSFTSVSTWAAKPSRNPIVQARLCFHAQIPRQHSAPKKSVWLMPMPGQPRCHW